MLLTDNILTDSSSRGRVLWIGIYYTNYIYFSFADRFSSNYGYQSPSPLFTLN